MIFFQGLPLNLLKSFLFIKKLEALGLRNGKEVLWDADSMKFRCHLTLLYTKIYHNPQPPLLLVQEKYLLNCHRELFNLVIKWNVKFVSKKMNHWYIFCWNEMWIWAQETSSRKRFGNSPITLQDSLFLAT